MLVPGMYGGVFLQSFLADELLLENRVKDASNTLATYTHTHMEVERKPCSRQRTTSSQQSLSSSMLVRWSVLSFKEHMMLKTKPAAKIVAGFLVAYSMG